MGVPLWVIAPILAGGGKKVPPAPTVTYTGSPYFRGRWTIPSNKGLSILEAHYSWDAYSNQYGNYRGNLYEVYTPGNTLLTDDNSLTNAKDSGTVSIRLRNEIGWGPEGVGNLSP